VPEGGLCFRSQTPTEDEHFASALYREYNVTVLPGSYLARLTHAMSIVRGGLDRAFRYRKVTNLRERATASEPV
jgi:hypothetical protein